MEGPTMLSNQPKDKANKPRHATPTSPPVIRSSIPPRMRSSKGLVPINKHFLGNVQVRYRAAGLPPTALFGLLPLNFIKADFDQAEKRSIISRSECPPPAREAGHEGTGPQTAVF